MKAKIYGLINEKGGVGKSTTAATTSYVLAKQGKKVLLIDFDGQGHASLLCGVPNINKLQTTTATLMNAIIDGEPLPEPESYLHHHAGVDLIPSNSQLFALERNLSNADFRETKLAELVETLRDGKDTAHYCDSMGFAEVPQFLEPAPEPDHCLTGDTIRTPRGGFRLTDMTKEQMEAAGYGFHHASGDGLYNIMANGTRAFAIRSEDAPTRSEPDNPLRTAEMTLEDDYGMIDGIVNNGRRGEELEKAKEAAAKTLPDKKPSIMERLEDAKRECAGRKSPEQAAPQKKPPELGDL